MIVKKVWDIKDPSSKIETRTNHKHEYIECLLTSEFNDKEYYYRAECCKICGKVKNIQFFESLSTPTEEMLEKYKDLPEYSIKDIFKQNFAEKRTRNEKSNKNKSTITKICHCSLCETETYIKG